MASGNPYLDDAPSSAPSGSNPYLNDTPAPATAPAKEWGFREYATEGLRAIGTGLSKAATSTAGLPADMLRLGQAGLDYSQSIGQGRPFGEVAIENRASAPGVASALQAAGSENLQSLVPITPPETRVGKLAAEGLNFAGQAAALPIGGATALGRAAVGAASGLASEGAGQITEGTAAEPYARLAGALAPVGAAAVAQAPSRAQRTVARTLDDIPQVDRADVIARAQALLDDARAADVPLSTAGAIDAASNGVTDLSGFQRHVEAMGRMRPFYAGAGDRTDAAARRAFDEVAEVPAAPSAIGPAAGRAAEQEIGATQAGINRETRPLYQEAERASITPEVQQALAAGDPLYARTLAEIRSDPSLNRTIAGLPDDSVAVQDLVSRRMSETAREARTPGTASASNLRAENLDDARASVDEAAFTATGSRAADGAEPAVAGALERARAAQAQLRTERLEPLMRGPLGKIAAQDTTTQQAISALFPTGDDLLANGQREIGDAMARLSERNPWAARQLVRAHAEGVFNKAAKDLQTGPNAAQGAKFAVAYRGNPQQALNNDAALRAVSGDAVADGFNRLLDVFEAMGRRQAVGSKTAYNTEELARMKQGGLAERFAANLATGGIKLPARIIAKLEEWRLGRNLDQLADLLTRPDAAAAFRGLAGSGDPTGAIGRLAGVALRSDRNPGAMQLRVQPRSED